MLEGEAALQYADLTFKVEGDTIRAHKIILHERSEYFERMLQAKMRERQSNELVIEECRPAVFRIVIRFLYGGEVRELLTQDTAQDVLMAAERFQVAQLKETVEAYLSRQLDASNARQMRELAQRANAARLERVCAHFELRNLSQFVGDGDVPAMTESECLAVVARLFDAVAPAAQP